MNFQQVLLWLALTLMIGCFVYIVYALIKEHKPDSKNKKGNDRKRPPPTSASGNSMEKRTQVGPGIVSPISRISNSNVEVVNIMYYPLDPASTKEQDPDNSRVMASFTATPAETEKRSSPLKNRKGRQE